MPIIKQAKEYFNLADEEYEPYDHSLIPCDGNGEGCNRFCEKGVGLCDKCLDSSIDRMVKDV